MLHLPIDDYLERIGNELKHHQNLVITAAPGAGKTTRLPAFFKKKLSGKIYCLEPRRMAAIAAAQRIAEEQNWELGKDIGYQVRFANKSYISTQLLFLTEALLSKKLMENDELKGVELIILDEFHERSVHVDIALGLIREMQLIGHPVKLIVMSATLSAHKISDYLGNAPIIEVPGKLYDLQIHYQKHSQILNTQDNFYENIFQTLKQVHSQSKDILVFLPGSGEIERCAEKIMSWCEVNKIDLQKLHGSLSLEEQKKVLAPSIRKRVILATNIAESSVTLDGVDTVIDSGLSKTMHWDQRTGFSRLNLGRISQSSAKQRSGRAARQFPGNCYRLWNKLDENSMSKDEVSEVFRTDLSEVLLYLSNQGVSNFNQFLWFEKPSDLQIRMTEKFLLQIKAIDSNKRITALGKRIISWPLGTREALMIEKSIEFDSFSVGAYICSILQEKDFFLNKAQQYLIGDQWECDLWPRYEFLIEEIQLPHGSFSKKSKDNVIKVAEQIIQRKKYSNEFAINLQEKRKIFQKILLLTYPDKICRRRTSNENRALMIGGRGVQLSPDSLVRNSEFFIALQGVESDFSKESKIFLASGFSKDILLSVFSDQIIRRSKLIFNEEKKIFYVSESRFLEDLPLDQETLSLAKPDDVSAQLPEWCAENFHYILKNNSELNLWISRWNCFSTEFTQETLKEIFSQICLGESQILNILDKDLIYFFENYLDSEILHDFKKFFPAKIQVPSGSWIPINYSKDKPAFIEVRLQEIFGMLETPLVANKKLVIHLLAPNYRAVQVTQDLKSFWSNAYQEIRKELKIKYPKHSWPEDPTVAIAVAKGPSQKRH